MSPQAILTGLLALTVVGCAREMPDPVLGDPVVVYLVRHAERADDGTNDPPLSEEGAERARLLARILADARITRIHSTDLQRTRQTGAPITDGSGLAIDTYDPQDLTAFAALLRASPGRHLVLGHSNTTPDLVAALGGDSGTPIAEDEYDRLYVVVIPAVGPASTTLLRYGAGRPMPSSN